MAKNTQRELCTYSTQTVRSVHGYCTAKWCFAMSPQDAPSLAEWPHALYSWRGCRTPSLYISAGASTSRAWGNATCWCHLSRFPYGGVFVQRPWPNHGTIPRVIHPHISLYHVRHDPDLLTIMSFGSFRRHKRMPQNHRPRCREYTCL